MRSRTSELESPKASGDALEAELVQTIDAEAIEKWRKSGNDPSVLRRAQLTWKAPGGGTEVGYVGSIADR
ncbi:hypothetical protein [Natrarchaeobius chitinivorans]|uniref:Uncharacterized protein n=1 Tax=Natrarchaeobius chitinivorans TaxID=1679083 RepID=A0A3N6MJ14_NATCH|nr:hypothetical protein [Natrarchaeobius chitinivorans]RQG94086.1 hypothetical protein EA473_13550 [Natrarchaeobius chitinivorans]